MSGEKPFDPEVVNVIESGVGTGTGGQVTEKGDAGGFQDEPEIKTGIEVLDGGFIKNHDLNSLMVRIDEIHGQMLEEARAQGQEITDDLNRELRKAAYRQAATERTGQNSGAAGEQGEAQAIQEQESPSLALIQKMIDAAVAQRAIDFSKYANFPPEKIATDWQRSNWSLKELKDNLREGFPFLISSLEDQKYPLWSDHLRHIFLRNLGYNKDSWNQMVQEAINSGKHELVIDLPGITDYSLKVKFFELAPKPYDPLNDRRDSQAKYHTPGDMVGWIIPSDFMLQKK